MTETLRDLRKQSGKTAAEVAAAIYVGLRSYYHYEFGDRQINIQQVLMLAKLYNCTAEEIIQAQLNSCQTSREDNRR